MQKYDSLKLRIEIIMTLTIYFNKSSYVLYPPTPSDMEIKGCVTTYKIRKLGRV